MAYINSLAKLYISLISSFWLNRYLSKMIFVRQMRARYKDTKLGLAWLFVVPITQLSIFTVVFNSILGARWLSGDLNSTASFSSILLTGLIFYWALVEFMQRCIDCVSSYQSYLRKVVFPVEVLIPIFVAEACVSLSIYFLLLFGLVLVMEGTPHFSFFLIFLLFFLFVFFLCGVGWFLALLGAFFRDTSHLMSFVSLCLMFLSPIFYPSDILPSEINFFITLNPLTAFIENARAVLLFDEALSWFPLGIIFGISSVLNILGPLALVKCKKYYVQH